jgi:coenzyme F420 hydrogenase subunit beta
LSVAKLLEDVLAAELCTGCGACGLVCPHNLIQFDPDSVRPKLDFDTSICADCNHCHAVCPGLDPETDTSEMHIYGRRRTADERWLGIFTDFFGAHSSSEEIRHRSSSGGAVTTLLLASKARLDVRHILTMGRDPAEGWRASPVVSDAEDAVIANSQSTYQLAPYLNALRAIYHRVPDENIAVVGLACHVQAIRKLQRHDTAIGRWAKQRIVLIIETACSSNTLPAGTSGIISDVLLGDPQRTVNVKYREGAYPGKFQATYIDQEKRSVEFWQILTKLKENKTHRCLSCGDWMSGLADVSVCDGDPNIFGASLNGNTVSKHARVLVRTQRGSEIVEYAADAGLLDRWPIDLAGFNLGLERKKNRRRHYEQTDCPIPLGPGAGERYELAELRTDDELINPDTYRSSRL